MNAAFHCPVIMVAAADLAQRYGLHVLAVIDAWAMAGTFRTLAFGLQNDRLGLPLAGVLTTQVASLRHAEMQQKSLAHVDAAPSCAWMVRSCAILP